MELKWSVRILNQFGIQTITVHIHLCSVISFDAKPDPQLFVHLRVRYSYPTCFLITFNNFFRLVIVSQGNLILLCCKIADLFDNRDKQNLKQWPDVHPVLTYLVSRYFAATVVPASVKNALKSISYQSIENTNKYYQVWWSTISILMTFLPKIYKWRHIT